MRQPVPDRIYTQLRYCDFITLNCTAAGSTGMQSYSFRTSIFDPDYTGLGHQPLWHDQLQAQYGRYRVMGIKYRLTLQNTNTNQLLSCAIQHSTDPPETPAVGYSTILERRGVRPAIVGSSASRPTILKGYMPTWKPHGMTKWEFMGDDRFETSFGSNPTAASFLNIYCTTLNTSVIMNMQVNLTYYVELNLRAKVGQS